MSKQDQVAAITARCNALAVELEEKGEDAWPLSDVQFAAIVGDYVTVFMLAVDTLADEIAGIRNWPEFDTKLAQGETLQRLGDTCNRWITDLNAFYLVRSMILEAKREEN